jgi:MarR-like DNA-binding transcriptional regulator SgrR of sgrS sRNA
MAEWNFLTNHGRALLCIAQDPEVRLREIADTLGITERSAYSIVSDLADAGYIVKERDGRRNRYHIQLHLPLPNVPNRDQAIGEVLSVLTGKPMASAVAKSGKPTRSGKTTKRAKR